ncbi:hypothetical protein SKAU_G00031750 [Synaphobranchus kaupii]|uniref:Uncharacterized protein n=1 Tax=Synaphobranchus kaupii TaxID=118154 RepID=A0A9Q1GFT2_SYNKA|nr:hypothetical protein SKAU_G00031750 [Synaphobranchus kaupii]
MLLTGVCTSSTSKTSSCYNWTSTTCNPGPQFTLINTCKQQRPNFLSSPELRTEFGHGLDTSEWRKRIRTNPSGVPGHPRHAVVCPSACFCWSCSER